MRTVHLEDCSTKGHIMSFGLISLLGPTLKVYSRFRAELEPSNTAITVSRLKWSFIPASSTLGQRTSLLCSSFRWRIQVTTLFTAAVVLQSLTERNKLSHSWLMEIFLLILSVVSPFNGVFQPSTSYAQAGDTQPCAQRGPPTAALLPVSFSLLLQSFDLFLPGMI